MMQRAGEPDVSACESGIAAWVGGEEGMKWDRPEVRYS